MEIEQFVRKPFIIQAVKVTEENMEEVAEWCGGVIRTEGELAEPIRHIKVDVHNARSIRQTKAYVDDRVLQDQHKNGFKIYTPVAFQNSFERATQEQIDALNQGTKTQPKPSPKDLDHRDAGTGRYVTEEYAEDNPGTTVSETPVLDPDQHDLDPRQI